MLPPYFTDSSHCLPHGVPVYPGTITDACPPQPTWEKSCSVRNSKRYSKPVSMRPSHHPVAFCPFRRLLLVLFSVLLQYKDFPGVCQGLLPFFQSVQRHSSPLRQRRSAWDCTRSLRLSASALFYLWIRSPRCKTRPAWDKNLSAVYSR